MQPGSPVLTEIRTHGRGSKRRTLVVDGEPWRCVPAAVVRELALEAGDSVDLPAIEERIAEVAPRIARERSLRLLAARERTSVELLKRLLDDGYDEQTSRTTVDRLLSTGLIDDDRYTQMMARALIVGRGLGRGRALLELTRKGIDADAASAALDEYAAPEGESQRALEMGRKLVRAGDSVQRLAARLARRGFSPGDALSVARLVLESAGTDESFEPE